MTAVRLVVIRGQPMQEIAAQAATLDRFRIALRLALVDGEPVTDSAWLLAGGRGLLALPFVVDPALPELTVCLRPYSTSTSPMGPTP